jgi:1-acyl-sn-glycerol-3-phosphate acyltransferase
MQTFLTYLFIFYFFTSSFVLYCINALICLATAPFDSNRKLVHLFSSGWGHHYIAMCPAWPCQFEGKENIEDGKTYVLISNHQSLADIIVLYGLFKHFKWVSKEEIFDVPVVGWNMYLNQYVKIKRGNLKSIKEMLQTCKDWINKGSSVMMFPEGTRSPDGQIHPFRDGAFRIACETGVPLIPIVTDGTHSILQKGSKLLHRGDIRVKVLPPIDPKDFDNSSAKMRDAVHALMVKTLEEMRGKKPSNAEHASV